MRVTPGVWTKDFDAYFAPTLLEQAEDRGLSTGVVTTTTVTHATPAACYAHAADRSWQVDGRLPGHGEPIDKGAAQAIAKLAGTL